MKKFIIICFIIFVIFAALAAGSAVALYMWAAQDLPDFKNIKDYKPALVTTVYARDGEILGYFYREKRFLVELKNMPSHLPKAFLAAEDSSFFEHEGIDFAAILRAFIKNLRSGSIKQGGSTITQQIIKRLLLSSEKSYKRKIREAILAYRLERYLTKEEILTIYLNQIFLGERSYGVEAAARTYFGKHVNELTLAESALIAGLPQAPSKYNPYRHPEVAKGRQKYVLDQMLHLQWITQEEHDEALAQPLKYEAMPDISWKEGAYYLEEVRRWLVDYYSEENMKKLGIKLDKYGEDFVYESGLHVYTACDLKHQIEAEKAVREGLEENTKRRGWRGPIQTLAPDAYDAFLAENNLPADMMAPGQWVKALVISVDKAGAKVKVGEHEGYIDVKTMAWAHTINPRIDGKYAAKVTSALKVVKPGDVVWASILDPNADEQDGDKKPKRADKDNPVAAEVSKDTLQLALEQRPVIQSALVSIEPPTGEVVALVGGYTFDKSQFNRATQAHRQPGSSFKPIVYSAALDNGLTVASEILDAPFVLEDPYTHKLWKPQNFGHDFAGPMLLRTALVKSKNLVTVRIAQQIGIENVIARAKALGLEPDYPAVLAISLGAVGVTPFNQCQAYTAFARGGSTIKPRFVLSVKAAWGEELYHSVPEIKEVISPQNAYIMCFLMQQVVQAGTGSRARALGRPVGGKTGTTNDEQDAWFMGFAPYLLTAVWVGFDEVQPMGRQETGSRAALPIWLAYRQAVEDEYPEQDFPVPPGIVFESVGDFSLPFVAGTEPSKNPQSMYGVAVQPGGTSAGNGTGEAAVPTDVDMFKQFF